MQEVLRKKEFGSIDREFAKYHFWEICLHAIYIFSQYYMFCK